MEISLAGVINEDKLPRLLDVLTALGGHEPRPIVVHEMILRYQPTLESVGAPKSLKSEVRLRRYSDGANASESSRRVKSRWVASQYGRPPWGDLAMAKMPATVRTVVDSCCSGPDVLGFWKGLGFVLRRENIKRGFTCDVFGSGVAQKKKENKDQRTIHFLVSQLSVNDDIGSGRGEQTLRGLPLVLVEAWVRIDLDERYEDAIQTLVDVSHVVAQHCPGVGLSPLPSGSRANRQA